MNRLLRIVWAVFLLWLIAWPLCGVLFSSLEEKGFQYIFEHILKKPAALTTMRTALLAASVSLLAAGIGTILGWFLAFHRVPAGWLINFTLLIPLVLPNYVFGIAWADLVGSRLYGFWGCVFVLTLCWFPLPTFLVRRALQEMDCAIHEAARVDGASEVETAFFIDIPVITPVVFSSWILISVLVLGEFGVPSLLLVHVSSFDVYTEFSAFYDTASAAVSAFPVLATAMGLILLERIQRRGKVLRILTHDQGRETRPRSERVWPFYVILTVCMLPGLIPLGVLVHQSIRSDVFPVLVRAYRLVDRGALVSIYLSFQGAAASTLCGLLISITLDRRLSRPLLRLVDPVAECAIMLLLAVPPVLWSLSLIRYWNQPDVWMTLVADSTAILTIGYVGRFLPITYRICRDGLDSVQTESIEMGQSDGANFRQLCAFVLWPLLRPTILVAFAIGFVFCFGELAVTLLCAPPGVATLPVRLYTIMANSPTNVVATVAVFLVSVCVPCAALALWISGTGLSQRRM